MNHITVPLPPRAVRPAPAPRAPRGAALLLIAGALSAVALHGARADDAATPVPAPSPDQPKASEFLGRDRIRMSSGMVVLYYRVNFVDPANLAKELELWKTPNATVTPSGAQFVPAPATTTRPGEPSKPPAVPLVNALRIMETAENLPNLERVLAMLDVPQPQVRVDVKVVELSWDEQTNLGFTSKVARPVGDTFFQSLDAKFPNTLDAFNGASAAFRSADKYITFDYVLQAAAQGAKTDLKSQPSVLASQGETAIVRAGDEEPIVQQSFNGNNVTATTIFKPVGVRLEVQPLLVGRDSVRVRIAAEASRLSDFRITATSNTQQVVNPVITSRNAETVVTVPNGETIIIGGLDQTSKRDVVTGIPLLMDIPLLGALFRSTTKRDQKSELLFFITISIERPEEARLFIPPTERARQAERAANPE